MIMVAMLTDVWCDKGGDDDNCCDDDDGDVDKYMKW